MGNNDYNWKIGGQAGEGIDTSGDLMASSLALHGFNVFTHREFPSRIRGGYTSYEVRFGTETIYCKHDYVDFVVAFDQESIDNTLSELKDNSIIVYNSSSFELSIKDKKNMKIFPVPLSDIAAKIGNPIMKNMVSLGVTIAILEVPEEILINGVKERFGKKGEAVVSSNIQAIKEGIKYVKENLDTKSGINKPTLGSTKGKLAIVAAADAVGLGALIAGCKFYSGYPITPATEIMEWLVPRMKSWGGTVVQAEDELAAINMVLGSSFTGARAMTATSGPGLDLMTETIGLASITETPAVIIDVQRAGPSTGMPTKHEDSDLWQAIFSSHGDGNRIVLAASTPENSFLRIQEAFNYADKYQTPVILLLDQDLLTSKRSVDISQMKIIPIDRGKMASEEMLSKNTSMLFKRYGFTEDGISIRTVPSQKNGLFLATGDEHNEEGSITEKPEVRVKMMDKRMRKYLTAKKEMEYKNTKYGDKDSEITLIGFCSTIGPSMEVMEMLKKKGHKVAYVDLSHIWPFPDNFINETLKGSKYNIVIENNQFEQLKHLIKMYYHGSLESITKYDGTPFKPLELLNKVNEVIRK
ncbi:MAG: 2-oxoacid:acceptor oxidoreductase subunit alpha [Thermoplasmata archaeon]